ncbi:opacity protein-like surface antigen [Chryseobacterium sp. H1D6B]|uniref:outer membrane beta-barrel protein n=1 Tax=Chryseobacterium sp. H1D6B TaxID=2940588 RepID=UPI0015CEA448|nr:outer membrane beta-barrel protein [Chryseobacterium sp. H1D6B]MDH6250475.1 opacity protein-like surface antigen [Chryseobacterium sp. H1D6B]
MILKKLFSFLLIVSIFSLQGQRKKTDTLYVYEKVIVHDTIYLEKSLKRKSNDIVQPSLSVKEKEIKNRSLTLKNKDPKTQNLYAGFQYGIGIGIGLKNSSWAKELSNKKQSGENLEIWVSKNILTPSLSLLLAANIYRWNSTFDLDGNKEDTFLNGYYFTQDRQPLLFQTFNNKHFEYVLRLEIGYEWKNFRPFAGFLVNRSIYKMQFLVPENNVLDKLDDFKSNQNNYGFTFGIQYKFFKRFLVSLDYQYYKMKNLSLKNSSFDFDIFKANNTFAERKLTLGLSYILSK